MSIDRRVHAQYRDMEIVRYDRSGKWYLEPAFGLPRQRVSLGVAVQSAKWGMENAGGSWFPGLPGGAQFDSKMRKAVA